MTTGHQRCCGTTHANPADFRHGIGATSAASDDQGNAAFLAQAVQRFIEELAIGEFATATDQDAH
jgi:hypothetical protein